MKINVAKSLNFILYFSNNNLYYKLEKEKNIENYYTHTL